MFRQCTAEFPLETEKWGALREASDYRQFLRAYLEVRSLTFADLARAAGFQRGFPSDVVSGRRRLTERSCHAMEKALKIPASGRRLFRALVAFAEPDLFPNLDRRHLERTLTELRERSWERARRELPQTETSAPLQLLLRDRAALLVYAAAGKPGHGASQADIEKRTRIAGDEVSTALKRLIKCGLITEAGTKFLPQDLHLFMRAEKKSDAFVKLFQDACAAAADRAEIAMPSDEEFFFASTFCVREKRLPELKAALRQTVLSFIDDAIDAEGDRVVRLVTGLHRTSG